MPWATFVKISMYAKGGVPNWGYSRPLPNHFYFFAGEQTYKCTLSWHTSACTEAVLFSSYKALKVGGVIQYDSD